MADVVAEVDFNSLRHPYYASRIRDWQKWRLTFMGGQDFLQNYLVKFSKGEDDDEFQFRKGISYSASFAKAAVIEVRNSIYQRLSDISREGGTTTYKNAVAGLNGGVDLLGSSMNTFMGTEVLPELLVMDRVGVYVDMPPKQGPTIADNIKVRPYLYFYGAEDILTWDFDEDPTDNQFRSILLRDTIFERDETTGLPKGEEIRYRYYWKDSEGVWVQFFNKTNQPIGPNGESDGRPQLLGITRIPFIVIELGGSLMVDIADYQVALTNLASADMSYCLRANFPFYTEQFDPRYGSPHLRRGGLLETGTEGETLSPRPPNEEIEVGPASGRRYPIGADRPEFISPPTEPMKASMEKQEQLKIEIRLLINLAISNIQTKMASAESKGMDERTLESGLSYIGLILEDAERQIAVLWSEYEGSRDIAAVNYPSKYSLKSDDDRRRDAKALKELMDIVPSDRYRREIAKQIATIMLAAKVSTDTMNSIYKEIEDADVVNVIRDLLKEDVEAGLCDPETASRAAGYPEGTVEKAQKAQAERLKLIQESQKSAVDQNAAARGNPDASVLPNEQARQEKDGKQQRGPGQNNNPIPAE